MTGMTYKYSDVKELLNIEKTRLYRWFGEGFLPSPIRRSGGHGYKKLYSVYDLFHLALFKYLVESGINRRGVGLTIKQNKEDLAIVIKNKINCKGDVFFIVAMTDELDESICRLNAAVWWKHASPPLQNLINTFVSLNAKIISLVDLYSVWQPLWQHLSVSGGAQ